MIRQTSLIFELKDLSVYLVTEVGASIPLVEANTDKPKMTQEIWWADLESPKGHGPFPTVSKAMVHYSQFKGLTKRPPAPPARKPGDVVDVDFKAKKRVNNAETPSNS